MDGDASDDDEFTLDYDTSVSVWYKPPKTGLVDVWIIATCSSANYALWLQDEFGWSDSDTYMSSHITASVSPIVGDEDLLPIWDMDITGNPDDGTYYTDDKYPPGNLQTFHLTTSQAALGGAWTLVRVGTFDRRQAYMNDVSTSQLMRNHWFVIGVFLRTQ
jgi:hypothetical protein